MFLIITLPRLSRGWVRLQLHPAALHLALLHRLAAGLTKPKPNKTRGAGSCVLFRNQIFILFSCPQRGWMEAGCSPPPGLGAVLWQGCFFLSQS